MSNYIFGRGQQELIGDSPKYIYGLRRTDEGELFFCRVNQLSRDDSFQINNVGDELDNFTEFEVGVDFFEGRDVEHEIVFGNLIYEQYRWDDKDLYYYVDTDGQLVLVVNQKVVYPAGISS